MSEEKSTNENKSNPPLKAKSKSILRWEAFTPAIIIIVLIVVYFNLFFDFHLKKAMELAGYHGIGAEFNVSNVKTSFLNASLQISDLQATNPDKPTHNLFSIGDIKFAMSWDALLRGKIVIEIASIEQISYDTQRKTPGLVKPPEPPSAEDGKPSFLETESEKLAQEGLAKAQSEYGDNVLGDVAALLSGASGESQIKELENQLLSKKKMVELQKLLNDKSSFWNQKVKTLPQEKDFKLIGEKLSKVKTSNFKSPDELKNSLDQAQGLIKELEVKGNEIKASSDELSKDLKNLDQEVKSIEGLIQQDIKNLQAHFKLPKIDANSISKSLLNRYAGPYLNKFYFYRNKIYKYVPPGLVSKSNESKGEEVPIQPRPRADGVTYEFGKQNSYPLFWLKKAVISSTYNPQHPESGSISGEFIDLTSNPKQTRKPMIIKFSGEFPGLSILDLLFELNLNHHQTPSQEVLNVKVGSYPVSSKTFVKNNDIELGFNKATGYSELYAQFTEKHWAFKIDNQYSNIAYVTQAKNSTLDEVLKRVFNQIPKLTIKAQGEGDLPNLPIDIRSNLGDEIASQLQIILEEKITEAQKKIQKIVDEQITKEKQKIDAQLLQIKNQAESEMTKIKQQVESQKAEVEAKSNEAKKDFEKQANKAKTQVEQEIKKQLGPDADKKINDLKKKFKL